MPTGLLEPRLYRAAFVPALLALIVLAFSVKDVGGSLTPEFAPPTFSGPRAIAAARDLVRDYGPRESGSIQDAKVAKLVTNGFTAAGLETSSYRFSAVTLSGSRELVNVLGVRPGPSDRRIVVVASRDGKGGDLREASAAETGILLELARVIEGRSFGHTLVLASVSGGIDGGLGAGELARKMRRPVDGVIAIRNVATKAAGSPLLATYNSRDRPDPRFIYTVGRAFGRELGGGDGRDRSPLSQLVRLGFPLALGEQASMPAQGLTSVSLSPGGEPLARPDLDDSSTVAAAGRAVLRTITTLDGGFRPRDPAPADLELDDKFVPGWALILFLGLLLLPLLVAAIDGWARARRWRHDSRRGFAMPLATVMVLAVLAGILRLTGLSGIVHAPPMTPEPLAIGGSGPVVFAIFAALIVVILTAAAAAAVRQLTSKGGEAGLGLWVAFAGIAVFAVNPVAAGFVLPLLHLTVVFLLAGTRPRRLQVLLTLLVGMAPLVVAVMHYTSVFGLSIADVLRYGVLYSAGGAAGLPAIMAGCVLVGAIVSAQLHLYWNAPIRD